MQYNANREDSSASIRTEPEKDNLKRGEWLLDFGQILKRIWTKLLINRKMILGVISLLKILRWIFRLFDPSNEE